MVLLRSLLGFSGAATWLAFLGSKAQRLKSRVGLDMAEPMPRKRRRGAVYLDSLGLPSDIVREGHGDLPWAWRLEDISLRTPHPRASKSQDVAPLVRWLDRDLTSPPSLRSFIGFEPAARRQRTELTITWEPFFAEKGPPRDLPEILVSEKSATLPWAWRLPFS